MTDIAMLGFAADTSSLKKAEGDLDAITSASERTESAAKKASTGITTASSAVGNALAETKTQADSSATSMQQLAERFAGVNAPINSATQSAQAFAAAMGSADKVDQLRRSIDPLYAASKRYEEIVRDVNEAVDRGAVSQREANRVMDQAQSIYLSAGAAATTMGQQHRVGAHEVANLSYQFNDIAMMMAAGQNPLMLAMQQGTQISQVLGPMGATGAVRGLGAAFRGLLSPMNLVIIVGIAAGAAAFQWLTSAGDDADTLGDRLDDLADNVDRYRTSVETARTPTAELAEEFGSLAGIIRELSGNTAEILRVDSIKDMESAVQSLVEQFDAVSDMQKVQVRDELFGVRAPVIAQLREELGLGVEEALRLDSAMEALGDAKGPEAIANAVAALSTTLTEVYGEAENIPSRFSEMVEQAEQIAKSAGQIVEGVEQNAREAEANSMAYLKGAAEAAIERGAAEQKATDSAYDLLSTYREQAHMQEAIARHGAESADVAELRSANEARAASEMIESLNISQDLKDELHAAYSSYADLAAVNAAAGISDAANEASRMAGEIERAVSGMITMASQAAIARRESEIRLQNAGDPVATAGALTNDRLNRVDVSGLDSVLQEGLDAQRAQAIADAEAAARNQQTLSEISRTASAGRRSGSRGGKSESQREAERIENEREREASKVMKDVERSALDAMSATERFNAELTDLHDLYKDGYLSAAEYSLAVDMLSDEMEKSQFEKVRQGIESISDAMAQAIVNGDDMGDAISGVIQNIARQLIQSGINEMIAGMFSDRSTEGGGIGGVLGGFLRSFDGGGSTGNAPRSGGLDGQGGFLGILHPQETVIDHSKGQSGGAQKVAVDVRLDVPEGVTVDQVQQIAGDVSVNVMTRNAPGLVKSQMSKAQMQGFTRPIMRPR